VERAGRCHDDPIGWIAVKAVWDAEQRLSNFARKMSESNGARM
jgi:hypothetical protein